jgi:hypothetical protein
MTIPLVLSASPAFAYRPFYTEDAGVAGLDVTQAELSWDSYKMKNGDAEQVLLLVAPIYGITEDIELSVETPYVTYAQAKGPTASGLGDVNLVAKYVLAWDRYDTKDALLTLKTYVKLDSGNYDKMLGRGDTEYVVSPVLSKIISETVTVHAQVSYAVAADRQDPDLRNYAFGGVAIDYGPWETLHFVAEYNVNQDPDRGLAVQRLGQIGLIYVVSPNFVLDATYKQGAGPTSPTHGYGVGCSIQF